MVHHGCDGSSQELSSPTAPVGKTCRFFFLRNHRGARSSLGRVFGSGELWSGALDGKSFFLTFGDDDRELQGTTHDVVGQNGCGAVRRWLTLGRCSLGGITTARWQKRANLGFDVLVLMKNWMRTIPFIAIEIPCRA
jgi:hypothetical protein